jgi:hypothetical protein
MKLKLDLHPIYSDSSKIESSLAAIIDEACEKRAAEIEIIPGKGSGALKKSVLRFLDRPDIKARYHRLEKDSDNWGRLFVHFRWDKTQTEKRKDVVKEIAIANCFCCDAHLEIVIDRDKQSERNVTIVNCGSCGSPNKVELIVTRNGMVAKAQSGYE